MVQTLVISRVDKFNAVHVQLPLSSEVGISAECRGLAVFRSCCFSEWTSFVEATTLDADLLPSAIYVFSIGVQSPEQLGLEASILERAPSSLSICLATEVIGGHPPGDSTQIPTGIHQEKSLPCGGPITMEFPASAGGSEWICECVEAICISNDTWQLKKKECIPPEKPKCSNGLAPVPVQDADGCCWHWECDCYCTGWGDPHYMTFDGFYYSFQGNCTYVLVEEIIKKHGNFGIYIDNYYCSPHETVSCPRTLIIKYETHEVHIRTVRQIPMTVQVLVNGVLVALPFNKHGMNIYVSGLNHVVEIPFLRTNVTYNGMAFTIKMPYHIFSNNTQGQCGTCTNSTADDCMLRSGLLAETCEIMADDWIVQDPNKPSCPHAPPVVRPTTTVPCTPSPLCELIKESAFQKCHEAVSPDSYYAACTFDSCMVPGQNMECASLQNYAATCADQGVCIDWRGLTSGACPVIIFKQMKKFSPLDTSYFINLKMYHVQATQACIENIRSLSVSRGRRHHHWPSREDGGKDERVEASLAIPSFPPLPFRASALWLPHQLSFSLPGSFPSRPGLSTVQPAKFTKHVVLLKSKPANQGLTLEMTHFTSSTVVFPPFTGRPKHNIYLETITSGQEIPAP
ncbi:Intestinal mucin-like protein [Varanus komodoensis]|nr:Intestinal mucin-like protein [Varanus komodoensis]